MNVEKHSIHTSLLVILVESRLKTILAQFSKLELYFFFDLVVPCLGTYPKNNGDSNTNNTSSSNQNIIYCMSGTFTQVVYTGFFESFQYPELYR